LCPVLPVSLDCSFVISPSVSLEFMYIMHEYTEQFPVPGQVHYSQRMIQHYLRWQLWYNYSLLKGA
jgi:hypothetical protein